MTAAMVLADLRVPLRRVAEVGVAVVPGAVAEPSLPPLLDEVDAMTYEPPGPGDLPVTTRSDLAIVDSWDDYPVLGRLRGELTAQVTDTVGDWRPNQVFVRRYRDGSTGMSPHQDGERFRLLVATLTVRGSAHFHLHDTTTGEIVETWPVAPGDLVLLRGPGLAGVKDGRPTHSVDGPARGLRGSVAFRMNSVL